MANDLKPAGFLSLFLAKSWSGLALLIAITFSAVGAGVVWPKGWPAESPSARTDAIAPKVSSRVAPQPAAAKMDLYGDALPSGAIARLGTLRFRNGMFKPCFLPDQKTLMTASRHSLQFWETATGRLLRDIPTGFYVHRTALSPDGKLAAAAGILLEHPSSRAVLRVWDTVSGKEVRTFAEKGRPFSQTSFTFTPDGKVLISISDGLIRFEEIASGKELRRLEIRKGIFPTFALSPDGETLAIAPGPNIWKFHLWNWKTEKEPREFKVPSRPLYCLRFSPDGKTLAVCDQLASLIHIWDVARAKVVRTVDMDKEAVCASDLAFSPDGTLLAVADSGNRKKFSGGLYLWDLKHDRYFRKLLTPGEQVLFTEFSGDSRRVAATTTAGVRVWEVATGRRVADVEDAHGGSLTQIAVSARALVATASYDHTVRLWDLNSGRQKMKLDHGGAVRAAALSPDGERLVTSCMDNSVRLWDLRTGTEQKRLAGHGEFGGWRTVGFKPDGRHFLSWGDDFSLRIVDVKSGKILVEHRVPPASTPTTDIERRVRLEKLSMAGMGPSCFSPNGKYFVLSFRDGFQVFETATGMERQTIPHPGASVTSLAFSADSRCFLASVLLKGGQKEHSILLCELATGKVRRSLVLPGEEPGPVAFSADGRLFAVGLNGSPDEVRVYNVAAEPAVATFASFSKSPGRPAV